MEPNNNNKVINVEKCDFIRQNGIYKSYKVIDTEGNTYFGSEEYTPGEHTVTITQNGNYTNIKKYNPNAADSKLKKGFPAKDYTFEKKKVAIEVSASLINSGKAQISEFLAIANKIFNWLKQPN